VLEVDPDNAEARRQVGQVAAAVRQFDRIAVGRRMLDKLRRRAHFRRWADSWGHRGPGNLWVVLALGAVLVLAALAVGWVLGARAALGPPPAAAPAPADQAGP
ncbi:MAG TPA: hypothetical protein VFW33_06515, partial [Gemmataceae bacterium]|nr:hypothetical protein [Gemmataceae bacterium]